MVHECLDTILGMKSGTIARVLSRHEDHPQAAYEAWKAAYGMGMKGLAEQIYDSAIR